MAQSLLNDEFVCLPDSYLFSKVAEEVRKYKAHHPESDVISLGIGDVTLPLAPAVCEAMHRGVDELSRNKTFKGYGPEHGQLFLRELIARYDYQERGINISESEIFISDGAKSDLGNITDLFSRECKVAVTDPVYPVYVDTNVMAGRAGERIGEQWSRIEYLPCTEANGFCPPLPKRDVSLIYLCYPNNPTGTVLNREQLKKWVEFAGQTGAVILFDSAYEAYITSEDIPRSIYEIPGAEKVAIEFRSFSKTAGFTGVRCGYTVVPMSLTALDSNGKSHSLNKLWERRQSTKFNGASYISQCGAAAVYTPSGRAYIYESVSTYMNNARRLLEACREAGLKAFGGENAPYIWVKTPHGENSWTFFHLLLERLNIVSTPGVGFGPAGEGFVRLTAFNTKEATDQAATRIESYLF